MIGAQPGGGESRLAVTCPSRQATGFQVTNRVIFQTGRRTAFTGMAITTTSAGRVMNAFAASSVLRNRAGCSRDTDFRRL